MLKIIAALFAFANFIYANGQDKEPKDHSAELINETRIHYCMFNDFESKETQDIDLEYEGFGKSKIGLKI